MVEKEMTMNADRITYRKATVGDIPFMTAMLLDCCVASGVFIDPDKLHEFPETEGYVKGWLPETEPGAIAENELGEPVGAAWVRSLPDAGHSVNEPLPEVTIAVAQRYRGRGIASQLMQELCAFCAQCGVPKLSLGVQCDNLPALKLYEKQGWVKDGDFRDYIMMSRQVCNEIF